MKIQKKHVVIGLIVLFITLFMGFGIMAIGKVRGGCDRHFPTGFHGRGFHTRHLDKDSPERMLSFLDKRIEFLDLNETQDRKYKQIRSKIKDHFNKHMEDRKASEEQLQKEIHRENPDINLIADLIKKRIQGMSSSMEEGLKYFAEFYKQLDENQKKLIIERFRHCPPYSS